VLRFVRFENTGSVAFLQHDGVELLPVIERDVIEIVMNCLNGRKSSGVAARFDWQFHSQ
jgi:hypothetical protein